MTITVSIVDDDAGLRDSISRFLRTARGVKYLSAYASAEEALVALPKEKPDVVLMDINMASMDGIECTRRLKERQAARGEQTPRENWWTEDGSKRFLNDASSLESAVTYILECQ